MSEKLPIFLHIPKNAGTYVLTVNSSLLRFFAKKNSWTCKDCNLKCLRRVHVLDDNGKQYITFLTYDPTDSRHNNVKITPHSQTIYADILNIKDLSYFLDDIKTGKQFLFSVTIEPRGTKLIKDRFFERIAEATEREPVFYTIFRKPFDRILSLYNYINSDKSAHEPTHRAIKAETFEEYILSNQLEECWLIRNICDIPNGTGITEKNFEFACNVLKAFKIKDILEADSLIDEVFNECYGVTRSIITDNRGINRHTTNKHTLRVFEELNDNVKEAFLQRVSVDLRLYNFFIK